MSEPQDVRLNLPDGTAVRPSETLHSVTDTGQRWDYTFSLEGTSFDPAVQQRMAEGLTENWQRAAMTMQEMTRAVAEWKAGRLDG